MMWSCRDFHVAVASSSVNNFLVHEITATTPTNIKSSMLRMMDSHRVLAINSILVEWLNFGLYNEAQSYLEEDIPAMPR